MSSKKARAAADRKMKALNKASELIRGGHAAPGQLERLSTETLSRAYQDSSGDIRQAGLVKQIKEILAERGEYGG